MSGRRDFSSLSDREVLALAISSEEEDAKIYLDYANGLRAEHGSSAAIFEAMAEEENEHRRRLIDRFAQQSGQDAGQLVD